MQAEKTGSSKGPRGKAPPGVTPRRARKDEVLAGEPRLHDIAYEAIGGEWVMAGIWARELSWEERSSIEEKFTKVQQIGRTQRVDVDSTGIMREQLDQMVTPERCDPPMTRDELRRLRGPLYDAMTGYFQLNRGAAEEVEEKAGESRAP